jgi:hypothetical protein
LSRLDADIHSISERVFDDILQLVLGGPSYIVVYLDLCDCVGLLYFADDRDLVVFRYLSSFQTSKVDRRRRNTVGIKDDIMLLPGYKIISSVI